MKPGDTMIGLAVSRIVETRNPKFSVGKLVVGSFGWNTKSVVDVNKPGDLKLPKPYLLPDFKGLPESLAVGLLGMPGNIVILRGRNGSKFQTKGTQRTFGFLEICKPKPGEVVVVSGAAGAVGSIVGQIAKIKGCKVIGFTGSDDKAKWLVEELGFDAAYNYKTKDIAEALEEAAPEGVDCYFDNLANALVVLSSTAEDGDIEVRISVEILRQFFYQPLTIQLIYAMDQWLKTGSVRKRKLTETPNEVLCTSTDTDWTNNMTPQQVQDPLPEQEKLLELASDTTLKNLFDGGMVNLVSFWARRSDEYTPSIQLSVLTNQLKMEGFMVGRWNDQWLDGLKQLVQWTKEGKLKYQETVTEGFENTPKALIQMLKGEILGKAVVKV
uniref:15-oxoprostaglandin 13-reductase n=1 Tax=Timema tahoe TaxID=61484 RepID=A0A7R9NZ74_9NEOP|nr:unnamed protein product [Timema tahoe]